MDSTSLAYREGRFAEIFDAARSSRLKKDEIVAYSQSLEKLRDTQLGIRYAAERARAEGLESVAINLLRQGMDVDFVASMTNLPIERLSSLL